MYLSWRIPLTVMLLGYLCLHVTNSGQPCDTPQYLEIGTTASIICGFPEDFWGVYWYNSTTYRSGFPIVTYQHSIKDGRGYTSGEFDIHSNGSLIINLVNLNHEHHYTVTYLRSRKDIPVSSTVEIIVFVRPQISFPVISHCGDKTRNCFVKSNSFSDAICYVNESRPAISLSWFRRTSYGDKNVTQTVRTVKGARWYNTYSSLKTVSPQSSSLKLFVCRAYCLTLMLTKEESLILVEISPTDISSAIPVVKFLELNSSIEMECAKTNAELFIWKRGHTLLDVSQDILYGINIRKPFFEKYLKDFEVSRNGSLTIPAVKVNHEGFYTCVYQSGDTHGTTVYKSIVYANPVPNRLIIDRCDAFQYCVLKVEEDDKIQCSVKGIRPQVHLEFRALTSSILISFYEQKLTVVSKGDVFDITLTSRVRFRSLDVRRSTIECRVAPNHIWQFSSQIDLWFQDGEAPKEQVERTFFDMGTIIWIALLLIMLLLLFIFTTVLKRTVRHVYARRINVGEDSHTSEYLPLLFMRTINRKQEFVTCLKCKYKAMYNAVQPIPNARNLLYTVNKVFVLNEMEIYSEDRWEMLNSYKSIFTDSKLNSRRLIIEGKPGYGKTTLCLKVAYDWCNNASYLKKVDLVIILPLRQMNHNETIYKAIKRLLLPVDTKICEMDISEILHNCFSAVILLDGFDEYPQQNSETCPHVVSIILNDMFQHIRVITTTRDFTPNAFFAQSQKIRLRGFSLKAQRDYIRKIIRHDVDDYEQILIPIKHNPVIMTLSHIPLIFAYFVNIIKNRPSFRQVHSVTKTFKGVMNCIQGHMVTKLKEGDTEICSTITTDHQFMNKVAFEILTTRNLPWRETLLEHLGSTSYDMYLRCGILVEEEVSEIQSTHEDIFSFRYRKRVCFSERLFCQWFSAHYLSTCAKEDVASAVGEFLRTLDPSREEYAYLFACGLSKVVAKIIAKYIESQEGGETFGLLCRLEQSGNLNDIKDTITEKCRTGIVISEADSLLRRKSTIRLLEIASAVMVPVSYVKLHNCITEVDSSAGTIVLESNVFFPNTIRCKELAIDMRNREMDYKDAENLLQFSIGCSCMEALSFDLCIPPKFFEVKRSSLLADLHAKNVSVDWKLHFGSSRYVLDFHTGTWQNSKTGKEITDDEYSQLIFHNSNRKLVYNSDVAKTEVQNIREALRCSATQAT